MPSLICVFLKNTGATHFWGKKIGKLLKPGSIVWLKGPLGAGKTTLAKAIAQGMGITESITSPTYTLVNEYPSEVSLNHMDLYRLGGLDEFEAMGGEEYFSQTSVCLIEWGERIQEILPPETIIIDLQIEGEGRKMEIKGLEI